MKIVFFQKITTKITFRSYWSLDKHGSLCISRKKRNLISFLFNLQLQEYSLGQLHMDLKSRYVSYLYS